MRWRLLGPGLILILLGAVVFSMWPTSAPPIPEPEVHVTPPVAPSAPPPVVAAPVKSAEVAPQVPPPTPSPTPPPPPSDDLGTIDEEPDWAQLKALGLTPADLEPLDGGVLHPITRDGIKAAVQAELPQIRECYELWLRQNPALSGKMKVQFTIAEIPGRDRSKIVRVDVADGGLGHVMMEGCVRNVFKGLRFETPRGGETRVTYPLSFQNNDAPPQ